MKEAAEAARERAALASLEAVIAALKLEIGELRRAPRRARAPALEGTVGS